MPTVCVMPNRNGLPRAVLARAHFEVAALGMIGGDWADVPLHSLAPPSEFVGHRLDPFYSVTDRRSAWRAPHDASPVLRAIHDASPVFPRSPLRDRSLPASAHPPQIRATLPLPPIQVR